MLALPDSPTAALLLADWLELQAILSPDGNSSRGDLESALRPLSAFAGNNDDAVEQKINEVFIEVESRSRAAGRAYPFTLDYRRNGVIELKAQWTDFPAYTFCLCLSYFGWDTHATKEIDPPKLFEHVSCLAAKQYLHGEVIGFGSPRKQLPSSFASAVENARVSGPMPPAIARAMAAALHQLLSLCSTVMTIFPLASPFSRYRKASGTLLSG